MEEQAGVEAARKLDEVAERDLRRMKKAALLAVCREAELPVKDAMTRNELLKMVRGARRGGQDHHVHGKTFCPLRCGGIAYVYATREGKRYMRCNQCGYRFSRSVKE